MRSLEPSYQHPILVDSGILHPLVEERHRLKTRSRSPLMLALVQQHIHPEHRFPFKSARKHHHAIPMLMLLPKQQSSFPYPALDRVVSGAEQCHSLRHSRAIPHPYCRSLYQSCPVQNQPPHTPSHGAYPRLTLQPSPLQATSTRPLALTLLVHYQPSPTSWLTRCKLVTVQLIRIFADTRLSPM